MLADLESMSTQTDNNSGQPEDALDLIDQAVNSVTDQQVQDRLDQLLRAHGMRLEPTNESQRDSGA